MQHHHQGPVRRRTERVPCALPVIWLRANGDVKSAATDVNGFGMFIPTDKPPPIGSVIKLEVGLPNGPIIIMATVQAITEAHGQRGMGVQHFHLDHLHSNRWMSFYRRLSAGG